MSLIYNVFYHFPCNDGELARIIWEKKYPNSIFYKWNYGEMEETINILNSIVESSEIIFLDICPKLELLPIKHRYLIIDHHENAITSMKDNINLQKYKITMYCNIIKSGCMLTWDYCYPNIFYPLIIRHIGNKDIWNFSDSNTEPYCIGFNSYINNTGDMRSSIIKLLIDDDRYLLHDQFIKTGNKMVDINKAKAVRYFNSFVHNTETINDVTFNIIDIECDSSTMYKYLIDYASLKFSNMDVLRILHTKNTDKYIYSMRSLKDNITVDGIARKYGGNGHLRAAGYTILLNDFN